jgi:hypothetical protein
MKLKVWMMMLCLPVLISGCASVTVNGYCDIAKPHYFADEEVTSWLLRKDPQLLTDTIVHNEQYERLCDAS